MTVTVRGSRVARALSLFALAAECSAFVSQSLLFHLQTTATTRGSRCPHTCDARAAYRHRSWSSSHGYRALKDLIFMAANSEEGEGAKVCDT